MDISDRSEPDIIALRPFVPATDFDVSLQFYTDIGFEVQRLDDGLALLKLGVFSFLLQAFEAKGLAANFMMQLVVSDITTWWAHIAELNLHERYGVNAPRAPAVQPWGLVVAFIFDPSGVLWHLAEAPKTPR